MNFNSLDELYNKVLPALTIKVNENNNIITEKEIWDYLSKEKWCKSVDLSLAEMINDILKLDISLINRDVEYEIK